MTAVRVPVPLPPETIEKLMLYGRQIDRDLERIIGKPALYAMSIAIDLPCGLVMHRLANTDIQHAAQMFALAASTPIVEQDVQKLHEN